MSSEKFHFYVDETVIVRARTNAYVNFATQAEAAQVVINHLKNGTEPDNLEMSFEDYSTERLCRFEPTLIFSGDKDPDFHDEVAPVAEVCHVIPDRTGYSSTGLSIPFEIPTTYTGRNGTGKAIGLSVFDMTEERYISFEPINSKGAIANCAIFIPYDAIPKIIKFLTDLWVFEDKPNLLEIQ